MYTNRTPGVPSALQSLPAFFSSSRLFMTWMLSPKISRLCQPQPLFPKVRAGCSGTANALARMSSSRSLP